jgi:hypothetical protein
MRTPPWAAVEEENFFGKHSGVEPEAHRWEYVVIEAPDPNFTVMGWQQAASGYAAVWATENTREAIFDVVWSGARKPVILYSGTELCAQASVAGHLIAEDRNIDPTMGGAGIHCGSPNPLGSR